jgi:hypothetical protein
MMPSGAEEGGFSSLIRHWWALKSRWGPGFHLLWGRPARVRFLVHQLRTAPTQVTVGLLEHDFLSLCL